MTMVGYARVSSKEQKLDIQIDKLKKHGCTKIFKEKISGVDQNRPELIKCKEYLREDDTLVITKLDRMARSSIDLGNIIKVFKNKNISLVVIDQQIDTTTSYGNLVFHILASVAQFENEIRKERQIEGIAKAKKKGIKFGRPPVINNNLIQDIINDIKLEIPTSQILNKYPISRSTYYRIKSKIDI